MVIDGMAEILPSADELATTVMRELNIAESKVRDQTDSDIRQMLSRLLPPRQGPEPIGGHRRNLNGWSSAEQLAHVWGAVARQGKEMDFGHVLMELVLIRKELAQLKVPKSAPRASE